MVIISNYKPATETYLRPLSQGLHVILGTGEKMEVLRNITAGHSCKINIFTWTQVNRLFKI